MSDPNALPIAGWYPDPEDDKGDRWWNGATWSDHRRPRNAGPGWAPVKTAKKPAAAAPAVAATAVPVPPAAGGVDAAAPGTAPAVPAAPGIPVPPPFVNPYAGAASTAAAPYAQPTYAPYAPMYAPNYAPPQPMRNPLALAGMITSLVALLFNWIIFGAPGIVGAIISFIGLRRANQLQREGVTVGNGKAMAITGIVSGLVGAFLWNLFYFGVMSPLQFS
ncbi:MAG: DUF2510 domain-containing protein [Pseudolysinimonas sp.]